MRHFNIVLPFAVATLLCAQTPSRGDVYAMEDGSYFASSAIRPFLAYRQNVDDPRVDQVIREYLKLICKVDPVPQYGVDPPKDEELSDEINRVAIRALIPLGEYSGIATLGCGCLHYWQLPTRLHICGAAWFQPGVLRP